MVGMLIDWMVARVVGTGRHHIRFRLVRRYVFGMSLCTYCVGVLLAWSFWPVGVSVLASIITCCCGTRLWRIRRCSVVMKTGAVIAFRLMTNASVALCDVVIDALVYASSAPGQSHRRRRYLGDYRAHPTCKTRCWMPGLRVSSWRATRLNLLCVPMLDTGYAGRCAVTAGGGYAWALREERNGVGTLLAGVVS